MVYFQESPIKRNLNGWCMWPLAFFKGSSTALSWKLTCFTKSFCLLLGYLMRPLLLLWREANNSQLLQRWSWASSSWECVQLYECENNMHAQQKARLQGEIRLIKPHSKVTEGTVFCAEGFYQLYQIICPWILRSLQTAVPNVEKLPRSSYHASLLTQCKP